MSEYSTRLTESGYRIFHKGIDLGLNPASEEEANIILVRYQVMEKELMPGWIKMAGRRGAI